MNRMFKKIIKYRLVGVLSLLSALFVIGGFLWVCAARQGIGSGPLILHFNDIDGINNVGDFGQIWFMGILGILVVITNTFIAFAFEERDLMGGKIIAISTLIFSILLFIGFASILNVN